MGFHDLYRMSVHAVLADEQGRVLLLRATYADQAWGLPGGAVDPGETVHEALLRECREELGVEPIVRYLSGVYYHSAVSSHVLIFRCDLPDGAEIVLSPEHAELRWTPPSEMAPVQRTRVRDCLAYRGDVVSRRF